MSESYLGEIRMFAGNFAPQGWALCNGQLLSIAENEALFSLLGTTYGGNGQTTFALPDLQGRVAVHPNSSNPQGAKAGSENVTLISTQLPMHTHIANATANSGTEDSTANAVWATRNTASYSNSAPNVTMGAQSTSIVGGNQPHNNMMPTTAISFIISLYGVYPPQPY